MIKCESCSKDISPDAASCPHCGHPTKKAQEHAGAQALISLAIVAGGLWFFFGGGLEKQAAKDLKQIQSQVAEDAKKQYYIALQQGDPVQVCVQAGLVAAAYLQANDEHNYQRWKDTEQKICRIGTH